METGTDTSSQIVKTPPIVYSATSTASAAVTGGGGGVTTTSSSNGENFDNLPAKVKRGMGMRRQESMSKSVSGNFGADKRSEKSKGRRMAQVNQDIKIIEITRPTRMATAEKKKIPNTNEIFKFECEGELSAPVQGAKKHVKWHATFDKPIEQLIYPSLQRFDNEAYQEKRKVFKQLHGGMEGSSLKSSGAGNASSPTNHPPQKSPKSPQQPAYSFSENHAIKIDLLPDAMNVSTDFMFIHTPKWTVDVYDVKPGSPKVIYNPNDIEEGSSISDGNNSKSRRKTRSNLIRKQITSKVNAELRRKKKKGKKPKKSALSRILSREDEDENASHDGTDSYDGDSYDDDDFEDEEELHEEEKRARRESRLSLKSKTSLLEEIEVEGEKYLREQIKEHYQLKMEEEHIMQLEQQESLSPLHELKLSLQRKKDKLPPIVQSTADNLVSCLQNPIYLLYFDFTHVSFFFFLISTHNW